MEAWKVKAAAAGLKVCIAAISSRDPMEIMGKCKVASYDGPLENVSSAFLPSGTFIPEPDSEVVIEPPGIDMPTTAETISMLKDRLGKELYRIELDLQDGGRIAGKPCDCLSKKHRLGIEATAEELMSYERNPVYGDIAAWMSSHSPTFEPQVIAETPASFYQQLAPEVRAFRKQVMGTEDIGSILRGRGKGG